jgi:transcriptional regulator with XRE-family HTH domain
VPNKKRAASHYPHFDLPAVGGLLKRARERLRLTLRDVATHSGVSASQIMRMESGEFEYSASKFARVACALGLPPGLVMDLAVEHKDDRCHGYGEGEGELFDLIVRRFKSDAHNEKLLRSSAITASLCNLLFEIILSSNPVLVAKRKPLPHVAAIATNLVKFAQSLDQEMSNSERLALINAIVDRPFYKLQALGILTDELLLAAIDRDENDFWDDTDPLGKLVVRNQPFTQKVIRRIAKIR